MLEQGGGSILSPALVTVLPEYAVDLYYAHQAGRAGPEFQYVHYAAANMTGANRLLVGLAWPLIVLLHWLKDRHRSVDLTPANAVEVGYLLLASLYAFVILFKGRISLVDFAVLVAIFGAYVWRVRNLTRAAPAPATRGWVGAGPCGYVRRSGRAGIHLQERRGLRP